MEKKCLQKIMLEIYRVSMGQRGVQELRKKEKEAGKNKRRKEKAKLKKEEERDWLGLLKRTPLFLILS